MLLYFFGYVSTSVASDNNKKTVLMVVSSYGVDQGKTQPGYEFEEFSKAYQIFKTNGIAVEVASPKGGAVEADEFNPTRPAIAATLADEEVMGQLRNTLSTANVKANKYQGMFIVGGKGAMFDLPKDRALQQLIAHLYEQEHAIAAVCHGPAALVNVKLADGSYLVSGKAINGFTNLEEKLFGKKWSKQFDFLLETKLKERGAHFEHADLMLSHVAIEPNLITGQNPTSTAGTALELVRQLGITPKAYTLDEHDRTFALISQLLVNDTKAKAAYQQNKQQYAAPLIGMYGYYYLEAAASNQQVEGALMLMTLTQSEINNPQLDLAIAKAYQQLGNKHQAKVTLDNIIAQHPERESEKNAALEMMKRL